MAMQDFIAVDWGTSSFRLWWLDGTGAIKAESRSAEGMQHCQTTGFSPVLARHLAEVSAPEALPVLICGMAGAKQGWREAPYATLPAPVSTLAEAALRLPDDIALGRDIRILPGLAQQNETCPDVMRGEETQLLGLAGQGVAGLVCMPGTHCKWARLEDGSVTGFRSYMTGEIFALLAGQSILRHGLPEQKQVSADQPAFRAAVEEARAEPSRFLGEIFGIRAASLLGFRDAEANLARLSGLLIGSEVASELRNHPALGVTLLGQEGLGALYAEALRLNGVTPRLADAEEATRQGLYAAAREIWGD